MIKADLVNVFAEFWNSGVVNIITNETLFCLIPKKVNSSKVKDFRPISLVTSLYKVITKVLSNRISSVMEAKISENQGAFVKGRQITDLILVADEVVEEMRRGRRKGVVLKLDFERAYDKVSWVSWISFWRRKALIPDGENG